MLEPSAAAAVDDPLLALLEMMSEGVSLSSEDGIIAYANPAEERLFGYQPGEMVGLHVSEQNAYSQEENERIVSSVIRTLEKHGSWTGEWLNKRKDGGVFVTKAEIRSVVWRGRRHWMCLQRDVAGEEKAALRKSEDRFRHVFRNAGVSLWEEDFSAVYDALNALRQSGVVDLEAHLGEHPGLIDDLLAAVRITGVNAETARLIGAADADEASLSLAKVFTPETRLVFVDELLVLWAGGRSLRSETVLRRLDGTAFPVAFSIVFAGEKASRTLVSVVDLSERLRTEEALRRSEAQFRILAESMPQLVWTARSDGELDYYNSRVQAYAGAHQTEDGAWRWEGLIHEDDLTATAEAWSRALKSGGAYQFTHRIKMADGSHRWHLSRAQPLRDETGAVVRWFGTATDIQDLRETEAARRESEARLNAALRAGRLGVYDYDIRANTIAWDAMLRGIWGVGPDEPISYETFAAGLHPDDLASTQAAVEASFDPDGARHYVAIYRVIHRVTRAVRWIRAEGETLFDGRVPVRMVGVAQDITDRKAAQERLRESEALAQARADELEAISDNAPIGIVVFDSDFRFVRINKRLAEVNARPAEDHIGRSIEELLPEETARALRALQPRLLAGEEITGLELEGADPIDGRLRSYLVSYSPLRSKSGEIGHFLGTILEISDRKRAELERVRAQDELRRAHALIEGITQGTEDLIAAQDFGYRFTYFNEAYRREFKRLWGQDITVGDSMVELMAAWPQEQEKARALWSRALAGETFEETMEFGPDAHDKRVYNLRFSPVLDGDGAQIGAAHILRDVTEQARLAQSLRESRERQRIAAEAAGLGIFDWLIPEDQGIWENECMYEIFGHTHEDGVLSAARFLSDYLHPEDRRPYEETLRAAIAEGGAVSAKFRIRRKRERDIRWLETSGRIEYAPDGSPRRMVGVIADVTEREEAERHRTLLIHELNHRVKNMLAVVQGVARQSFRNEQSNAQAAFEGRLLALSSAHALLSRENWGPVTLAELVESAARACCVDPARLTISGPSLRLQPKQAVAFAMAIHELATNAIKYGSLSTDSGTVHTAWTVNADGDWLCFTWKEQDGPTVSPPLTKGFGSMMIERALSHELQGRAALSYEPHGVVCRIEAPLAEGA